MAEKVFWNLDTDVRWDVIFTTIFSLGKRDKKWFMGSRPQTVLNLSLQNSKKNVFVIKIGEGLIHWFPSYVSHITLQKGLVIHFKGGTFSFTQHVAGTPGGCLPFCCHHRFGGQALDDPNAVGGRLTLFLMWPLKSVFDRNISNSSEPVILL